MEADRRWWRRTGPAAFLVVLSGGLLALNLAGRRSPVKTALLGVARPLVELVGNAEPPSLGQPSDGPDAGEVRRLREKNARLAYEVLRLRDLLAGLSGIDFDRKRYPFRALPAQVLSWSGVPGPRRMVLVDRGETDGVRKGMGVIAGDRAVGRIWRAGREISLVVLLTDPACKVRATFLPPGVETRPASPAIEGLCEGDVEREQTLRFRHLPRHAGIEKGWAVVATGFAGVFPAGLFLGEVSKVSEDPEGLFLNVFVEPAGAGVPLDSVFVLLPDTPQGFAEERVTR